VHPYPTRAAKKYYELPDSRHSCIPVMDSQIRKQDAQSKSKLHLLNQIIAARLWFYSIASEEETMIEANRVKYLRVALMTVGLILSSGSTA
jgi:hypothetical protein